jgi:hypothetical protein
MFQVPVPIIYTQKNRYNKYKKKDKEDNFIVLYLLLLVIIIYFFIKKNEISINSI